MSLIDKNALKSVITALKQLLETEISSSINGEILHRQTADNNLQSQIDAITVSSDVVDIVGTYQDLVNYDTQHIKDNDIIKVLTDSTHNDAISYYRYSTQTSTWNYVGSEGPYYTKSETNTELNKKVNIAQGSGNIGKVMTVNNYGNVEPQNFNYANLINKPRTVYNPSSELVNINSITDGVYDAGSSFTLVLGSDFETGTRVEISQGAVFTVDIKNSTYSGIIIGSKNFTNIVYYQEPNEDAKLFDLVDYIAHYGVFSDNLAQETGSSETVVMSQKATTDAIDAKKQLIEIVDTLPISNINTNALYFIKDNKLFVDASNLVTSEYPNIAVVQDVLNGHRAICFKAQTIYYDSNLNPLSATYKIYSLSGNTWELTTDKTTDTNWFSTIGWTKTTEIDYSTVIFANFGIPKLTYDAPDDLVSISDLYALSVQNRRSLILFYDTSEKQYFVIESHSTNTDYDFYVSNNGTSDIKSFEAGSTGRHGFNHNDWYAWSAGDTSYRRGFGTKNFYLSNMIILGLYCYNHSDDNSYFTGVAYWGNVYTVSNIVPKVEFNNDGTYILTKYTYDTNNNISDIHGTPYDTSTPCYRYNTYVYNNNAWGNLGISNFTPMLQGYDTAIGNIETALDGKQAAGDYATNTALSTGLATKQNKSLKFSNITIASTDWIADSTYSNYSYKAIITCTGITANMIANVYFSGNSVALGTLASFCETGNNSVTIYCSDNTSSVSVDRIEVIE